MRSFKSYLFRWVRPVSSHLSWNITCAAPLFVFLIVYVPAAGHGFLSDDFRWILNSRIESLADVLHLFRISDGFYRPLVSLTFGVDRVLFGLNPRPYGWTNIGFALLTGFLIHRLAIALGLPRGAAILAASLWLLNFHGINLSILWVSGRTALLVAAAAAACATFIVKRNLFRALACLALALLSKEEAFTLPFVLAFWLYALGHQDKRSRLLTVAMWLLGAAMVMAVYLVLRSGTGAMTPATAPSYYRFTFAPAAVARNALEYADRAATTSMIAVVVGAVLLWRRRVRLEPKERRMVFCGLVWLIGGYGITLFLPVRSSLYAVAPSIGGCLVAAVLLNACWRSADNVHRSRATVAAVVLPFCMLPVYLARRTSVPLADLSTQVLRDLQMETRYLADNATVLILDDRRNRINVLTAFGSFLNDAVFLETGRTFNIWIEPPSPENIATPPCASCVALRLRVAQGRLVVSR